MTVRYLLGLVFHLCTGVDSPEAYLTEDFKACEYHHLAASCEKSVINLQPFDIKFRQGLSTRCSHCCPWPLLDILSHTNIPADSKTHYLLR